MAEDIFRKRLKEGKVAFKELPPDWQKVLVDSLGLEVANTYENTRIRPPKLQASAPSEEGLAPPGPSSLPQVAPPTPRPREQSGSPIGAQLLQAIFKALVPGAKPAPTGQEQLPRMFQGLQSVLKRGMTAPGYRPPPGSYVGKGGPAYGPRPANYASGTSPDPMNPHP